MYQVIRHLSIFVAALILSTIVNAAGSSAKQMHFASPEAAVKALIENVKNQNKNKIIDILGKEAQPLIESGDPVEDKINREKFLQAYNDGNKLEKINDTTVTLTLGKDEWTFPIPLMKGAKGWYFDTNEGKEEILNRRIGRNELSAINAILAYVDAQREYYLSNPQHDKHLSYAEKFLSSENKRDGLYYPVKEGEKPSPLGEIYAKAHAEGYGEKASNGTPEPYYGYYYRILKGQGTAAKGGEYNYVIHGKMIGGHALIAWPANYGNTGIMTFIVNQEGKIYEKDLGAETKDVVQKITTFNPDKGWQEVKEVDK